MPRPMSSYGSTPSGNVSSCERTPRANAISPALPAEDLEEALLRLIVDGAKELDGPEHADAHERVAEPPAEARQHRERHLDLHAQHLPALR